MQGGSITTSYVLAGEAGPVAIDTGGGVSYYEKDGLASVMELRDSAGTLTALA